MSANPTDGLVKILFQLDPGALHGSVTETLWAKPVGVGLYKLENSPFYAYGVSFEDIVEAEERDGMVAFKAVAMHGGHSTYRILLNSDNTSRFQTHWMPLQEIGCSYEEGQNGLLAVDVPPDTDIYKAYAGLEKGEADGVWIFDEGHCGHMQRNLQN